MLTKKQKNLLLFINKKLRNSGVSPSYEEMKQSLNLKSKSGIHRLISALEERGFIKRLALISESGIKTKDELLDLNNKTSIKTFLIGESLLKNLSENSIFSVL